MNLFNIIIPIENLDNNFRSVYSDIHKVKVLNNWAEGFKDRDGKFIQEFQSTFNSSFWELYLFTALNEYKKVKGDDFEVSFEYYAPDFYLPKLDIVIEATIASNAYNDREESSAVVEDMLNPKSLWEFNKYSMIRLSNSIMSKYKKYIDSYQNLEHVKNSSYIIAIQDFSQPLFYMGANRSIEAVLYNYYVDEEDFFSTDELTGKFLKNISKNNGANIDLGIFSNDKYSDISAIIFNPVATISKATALSSHPYNAIFTAFKYNPNGQIPYLIQTDKSKYTENILDGMYIYHNPYAKKPIDPSIFRNTAVCQIYSKNGELFKEINQGFLLFRSVCNIMSFPSTL